MTSSIQPLPSDVVHLIAAGEVIDSLAAVVRELAENSLDAGATRLNISVSPSLWRVQVADNGKGIDLTDLYSCGKAHSTSKIRSRDDLGKITSLGFRGEALHSLATLGELEILSRSRDSDEGWRVVYDGQGEPVTWVAAAIAPGTIVTVSNLFGNWQIRRQGLPNTNQQLRAIQATIHDLALCHPHVTWQVQQDGQPWFTISPGITPQQILPQILRQIRPTDLQQLSLEVPNPGDNSTINITAKIQLVLGLPDRCHRHRADWVRVATNRRLVRSPQLEQTLMGAMMRTLPRDRYPVCFLHLQICPSFIDWNRHPAKAEIYLHHLEYWQEQVRNAVEQALRISPETLPEATHNGRVTTLIKAAEAQGNYNFSRQVQPDPKPAQNASELGLIELTAVAQVRNTYILAEHPTGLWLVEQHIAHERVLYEELRDRFTLVPLNPAIVLSHLSPYQVEQLQRLDLDIEPFGEQRYCVRSIPELLSQRDDCEAALLELSLGGDVQTAQVAIACRSAIRNGTTLSLPEMQTLLDRWKITNNPRTCPHGRPIYLSLEESALSRFFKRHWVIGKSHGI